MTMMNQLNVYLSDLAVMFVKLHDLHWNVKGSQFVPVHQYTETQYDGMAEKLDAVAELMIMQGEKPAASMEEYLKLTGMEELHRDHYRDEEVVKIVAQDLEHLRTEAMEIHKTAGSNFLVTAMMEDHIADYNKELWFLKSMMA